MSRLRVLAVLGLLLAGAAPAPAALVYGIVAGSINDRLVTFDSAAPGTILSDVPVTGAPGSFQFGGIDARPSTGELFGIGQQRIGSFVGPTQLFRINPLTGQATAVPLTGAPLDVLNSTLTGVDFNPVSDALRIVDEVGRDNYRVTFDASTGNVNRDSDLAYAVGDPNFGQTPRIVASAYTNNFAGATSTTLYGVDRLLGVLVTQDPPNAGTLNTIGSLGIPSGFTQIGFDITADNQAFLSINTGGSGGLPPNLLYSVNLATGAASLIGTIGVGTDQIRGIAVVPGAGPDPDPPGDPNAVPEPASVALLGLGAAGLLGYRLRRRTPAAA